MDEAQREILRGVGIDPDSLGVINATPNEVRIEDKDIYIPIRGLPSGGRYYRSSMGAPITIKGMPFKVSDAIALHAMQDEENHEVIDDVFRRRIKGVPPEELLEMDRKYILAWLRDQSFSKAPLRRTFICESCGHVNLHRIVSLSDFAIYYLPEDASEPEFDLPESLIRVKLKFEKRKDVKRVKDHVKKFEGLREISQSEIRNLRIAAVIEGKSIETALEFMAELSLIDYSVLSTKFDECNMGFTHIAQLKCSNEKEECGHVNLVHIPFHGEYYIPRIGPDLVDKGESVTL